MNETTKQGKVYLRRSPPSYGRVVDVKNFFLLALKPSDMGKRINDRHMTIFTIKTAPRVFEFCVIRDEQSEVLCATMLSNLCGIDTDERLDEHAERRKREAG
jgi:hypothetical protein